MVAKRDERIRPSLWLASLALVGLVAALGLAFWLASGGKGAPKRSPTVTPEAHTEPEALPLPSPVPLPSTTKPAALAPAASALDLPAPPPAASVASAPPADAAPTDLAGAAGELAPPNFLSPRELRAADGGPLSKEELVARKTKLVHGLDAQRQILQAQLEAAQRAGDTHTEELKTRALDRLQTMRAFLAAGTPLENTPEGDAGP
jgi:hypothetical protein